MDSIDKDLTGQMLIASPSTAPDSYFFKSVIYVLKDTDEGTIGLVVNHPLPKLEGELFIKCDNQSIPLKAMNAYSGGPVDIEKGFILHVDQYDGIGKKEPLIKLSFNLDLLKKLARKKPSVKHSMFLFGYCGWGTNQLAEEIKNNYWIIVPPCKKIIFEVENKDKWSKSLEKLNINPTQYVDIVGTC